MRGKSGILLPFAFLCYAQQTASQSTAPNNQNTTQQQQQKDQPPPAQQQQQPKPAPLFGGQLGVKSSNRSKESATLGFNGIDPNGKVDAKMLAATPGTDDEAKVKALDADRPAPEQLDAFLKEGNLRKK